MKANSIESLINQLGNDNPNIADAAGQSLIAAGNTALKEIIKFLPSSSIPIRRRLVFLLGKLGHNLNADKCKIEKILIIALNDKDWKVRRNTAISLGLIGSIDSASEILQKLESEDNPKVRSSLILAFGKLANSDYIDSISKISLSSDEEHKALRKAMDRLSTKDDIENLVHTEKLISSNIEVELWCRTGMAEITSLEANNKSIQTKIKAPGRVSILNSKTLSELINIRTALFPIFIYGLLDVSTDPRKLGESFNNSPIAAEMIRLTKSDVVPYRLTTNLPYHFRRNWISEFAIGCSQLVNKASGYCWEVILKSFKGRLLLGARPTGYSDRRFLYRKRDIPASLHPTLAAAAVQLLPATSKDVIVDPFCGSGTLLAERALLGPYQELIGFDINATALGIAHTNLEGFKQIILRQADFTQLSVYNFIDAIITNPPYGQRVGSVDKARQLHSKLDAIAAKNLREGGYLIVFRPINFSVPNNLKIINKIQIDAGGFQVNLIVARKTNT